MSVIGNAHGIVIAAEKRFPEVIVTCGWRVEKIASHGNTVGYIRIVKVVIGQSETIMSGAERLVPILVLGTFAAVEFHNSVSFEFLH